MLDLFPNDVRIEVMLRLPFSSLMRFRSINKSWRHIIDSPLFRKLHVEKQVSSDNHDDPVLLKIIHNDFQELSIMHLNTEKTYNDFPTYRDFLNNNAASVFSGPVHGLICLYNQHSSNPIALCNPSLGEIKTLPSSPSPNHCRRLVGLGYDDLNKDYKIVQFSLSCSRPCPIVEVYSRKGNTWTVLPDHPVHKRYYVKRPIHHVSMEPSAAVVAHWVGKIEEETQIIVDEIVQEREISVDAIVSFDMRSEALNMIKIPCLEYSKVVQIYAKENSSFTMFACPVYKSDDMFIWEYRKEWIQVGKLGPFFERKAWPVATWKSNGLIVEIASDSEENRKLILYIGEIIKCFQGKDSIGDLFAEYRGSFISP